MSKLTIKLLVIEATVELVPETQRSAPAEVIPASERPGLAKTRPSNVVPFLRKAGGL